MISGLIGFIFGFASACYLIISKYYVGEMEVDYTDPMKDIYRLRVNNFDKIDKSKYVLFKVDRTHK